MGACRDRALIIADKTALVVSVVHLTIKSLLCCKQSSPARDRPAGCVSVCFRNVVVDRVAFARNRARMEMYPSASQ
jgi:hypothetical protein